VVAAAIAGAYLLRQRGVAASGADAAATGPDLVSAAIPVLIGGAGALVAVRLLPLPLDLLSRLAERGRGLVAVLALRRATRRANDRLLLTSLLTMAAVWSFAVASLSYLERSATAASWQEAGAGFHVALRAGTLPQDLSLDQVPGVEKIAYASEATGHVAGQGLQVSVLALDLADYAAVARGGWPESLIPGSMLSSEMPPPPLSPTPAPSSSLLPAATGGSSVEPRAPIPAIVSTSFAEQERLSVGDTTQIVLNGAVVEMSVAEILESFPTLDAGTTWIVAARGNLNAVTTATSALGGTSLAPTEAFVRAGESAAEALTAAARYQLPGQLILTDRYQVEADLRESADFSSAVFGLTVVSLAVALYGALAVLAALLLSGAERAREAAHLRVLGLTPRQESMLGTLEHGPTSILMVGAGIALGIGLFAFLLPGLGLGSLVGGQVDVGLSVEPLQIGAVAAAVCVVVGAAIAIETLAESIIEPAAALRRGLD
jgi:putative ABC transport system permease protein